MNYIEAIREVGLILPEAALSFVLGLDIEASIISEDELSFATQFYSLPNEISSALFCYLNRVRSDEALRLSAIALHHALIDSPPGVFLSLWSVSAGESFSSRASYLLPLLSLLMGCKSHKAAIEGRGFSSEIAEDSISAVSRIIVSEFNKPSVSGLSFRMMTWASFYMRGSLVRLGRLQFEVGLKSYPAIEEELSAAASFVYIHIPSGSPLLPAEVDSSLNLAREQLPKYYPELSKAPIVFVTNTWLLSPEISDILGGVGNIPSFASRFKLVSARVGISPHLSYIFGISDPAFSDFASLPEDTELRRRVKAHLLAGGTLSQGLGYIPNS